MNLSKENMYLVDGREGQYELTKENGNECFFMFDTNKYESFENPKISFLYSLKGGKEVK